MQNASPLYQAMTRPPAWGGVPVTHWLGLGVVSIMALQLSKSIVIAALIAIPAYGLIRFAALRDPYFFEAWAMRLRRTSPQFNGFHHGGSSHAPW